MITTTRCTVSTALLVPHERTARVPVSTWAGRLRARLADTHAHERRRWNHAEAVGTLANNAALIATHQGDVSRAEWLCKAQVRWQGRTARRARESKIALLSLQPWVNLGRLEALAGEWESALERFARLAHPDADGRVCLGTVRVPSHGSAAFLKNVYVIDSLKAMLLNRRWNEVLAFANRVAVGNHGKHDLDEARIVAYCRGGDPEHGAAVADGALPQARGWVKAVFALRRAEALGAAGADEQAAAALDTLAGVLGALSPSALARPESLAIVARVAQACAELGLRQPADALARRTAEAARLAEDEPLRIEALRVLAAVRPEGNREDEGFCDLLAMLEAGTGYARYRRNAQPPLRDPLAERLYEELAVVFAG